MEKKGLIGVICSLNRQETLVDWLEDKAITLNVRVVDTEVDLKSIMRELENLVADVIVIDEMIKSVCNLEYVLLNYIPSKAETKFVFVASAERKNEENDDDFNEKLLNTENYSILLPRYYADDKEACKQLFLEFVDAQDSVAISKEILKTYKNPKQKKGLFGKKQDEVVKDILFNEVKSGLEIPEDKKISEVEYFRSKRAANEKETIINQPENKVIDDENELTPKTELKDAVKEVEHHDDANFDDDTETCEANEEDNRINSILANLKDVSSQSIGNSIKDEVLKDEVLENPNTIKQVNNDIDAKIQMAVDKALKDLKLDLAVQLREMAKPKVPQTIIYVSELMERVGAVRFAQSLAFAFVEFKPNFKVGIYFNNNEGAEVLKIINKGDTEKPTAKYKEVFYSRVENIEDVLLDGDCNVKIVCLKDVGHLEAVPTMYDEFYVVVGGEPWDVPKLGVALNHFHEIGFGNDITYIMGATATEQSVELVQHFTKGDARVKRWHPKKIEMGYFSENWHMNDDWKQLVCPDEYDNSSDDSEQPKVNNSKNTSQNNKKKQPKKQNVFGSFLKMSKEEWLKDKNKVYFDAFLGYSSPDSFYVGPNHANGLTHPQDFKVVKNKLFQLFPEQREAVREFNLSKEHHDDAQK